MTCQGLYNLTVANWDLKGSSPQFLYLENEDNVPHLGM